MFKLGRETCRDLRSVHAHDEDDSGIVRNQLVQCLHNIGGQWHITAINIVDETIDSPGTRIGGNDRAQIFVECVYQRNLFAVISGQSTLAQFQSPSAIPQAPRPAEPASRARGMTANVLRPSVNLPFGPSPIIALTTARTTAKPRTAGLTKRHQRPREQCRCTHAFRRARRPCVWRLSSFPRTSNANAAHSPSAS